MSEQDGRQASTLQRPINDNKEGWKTYWKHQGKYWRREPEIDSERQKYLAERRSITPDIEQAIYPFKDIKLSRADVEWLLETHENGRGPVDWSSERDLHERRGIDLRGADLRGVDLSRLPLTCMRGGLTQEDRNRATAEQAEMAAVHLEGASLKRTRLERAILFKAHLEQADLFRVHLERANLGEAHLEKTSLRQAHMEDVHLEGSILSDENDIGPWLVNVRWENADLTVVKWSQVKMLADEQEAHQKKRDGMAKDEDTRLEEYDRAVHANRQLAVALQTQGLNEEAARFTNRALNLQRSVLWRQRKIGQYLFSSFLSLLAGYGYKPWRSFLAYLIVIISFATGYYVIGQTVGPHLSPIGSVVFSMTSFHGRGFFPGGIQLDDPLTILAAIEAFVGLLIEVTFIATLTQRLFGK